MEKIRKYGIIAIVAILILSIVIPTASVFFTGA